MPTAGTHITVLERLALRDEFSELVGSPNAEADSEEETRHKFAKLGAIGPDIFYAMADYGPDLQNLAKFLSAFAGSVECILELTDEINKKIKGIESDLTLGVTDIVDGGLDLIKESFGNIGKTFTTVLLAEVINNGVNFFPIFETPRQLDKPREKWFWADYLHYVRTGVFVKELFDNSRDNANASAFAYGYLSHYVTDVVGHPFINQVTGSLWRHYWQRHHLIENYVDAYVWPRWHDSHPDEVKNSEQALDSIRMAPRPIADLGEGAPFTFSRINDHINVGAYEGNDPLNVYIRSICHLIRDGLSNLGAIPARPNDQGRELREWAEFMANVFRKTYPKPTRPPQNLSGDGYPSPDDILQAYSFLRLFLRVSTEENFKEPEFPDIIGDVWEKIQDLSNNVIANLGKIPPMPIPGVSIGGGFSFDDVWSAIKEYTEWAIKAAIALGEAAFQFIKDAIAIGGVLLLDSIRAALYLINKALFDIYKHFRFVLVRFGYAIPFTDELTNEIAGGVRGESLWQIPNRDGLDPFPIEEIADLEERKLGSTYVPWVFPTYLDQMREPNRALYERPLTWVGPYGDGLTTLPIDQNDCPRGPDAFIERPLGKRVLLSANGPMDLSNLPILDTPFQQPEDFGGAIVNCEIAFRKARTAIEAGGIPSDLFPDYNLDGDRGYAWPCWDVADSADRLHPNAGQEVIVNPILIPKI